MPKIMLKTPEEYKRELELYKQLKSDVYTIFKTPEFQRQEMVQQLKLESESKSAAEDLIKQKEETKESPISEIIDPDFLNFFNDALEKGEDIFNINELNKLSKQDLLDVKQVLNIIKRVDKEKGNTKKSKYVKDSLDSVNKLLKGEKLKKEPLSPRRPPGRPPSKPSLKTSKSASGPGAVGADDSISVASVEKKVKELPQKIQFIEQTSLYKDTPSKLEKEINNNEFTLKDKQIELDKYFNLLKDNKNEISDKNYSRIYQKLKGRKEKFDEIEKKIGLTGRGLSKKSKSKSKSKSNLGKQDQIYYILSQRAGNNNKLMKKRLKTK